MFRIIPKQAVFFLFAAFSVLNSIELRSQNSCANFAPFCTSNVYNFPASTGVTAETGPDYGCLGTQPNPAWYYLQISQNGSITIDMSNSNNVDIDFIIWGPFNTLTGACNNLVGSPDPFCGVITPGPCGNIVDCSYSTLPTETGTIPNAQVGEFYIFLVTNFEDMPTNIIFQQTAGTGATDCTIINPCQFTNVTATPSACDPNTNTFSLSGQINATNTPTSGNLVITSNCGLNQNVPYPWSFPINLNIPGLPANGSSCTINLSFSADPSCDYTVNFTAPAACTVVNCPVTAGNDGPHCEGSQLNLSATTVAGATYSWTGPGGYTSSDQNPVINNVTAAMAGNYTVTVDLNGSCNSQSATTVVITPFPGAPNPGNNGPLCEGQTLQLNATQSGGVTYQWAGPNGYTSNVANPPAIPNSTIAMSGVYTVTASDGNCTVDASTTVLIGTQPTAPVINSNSPVCAGQALNLTAANMNGVTFNWSGPGGFNSTVQNPIIDPALFTNNGTYSVYADINGCQGPVSTIDVVIIDAPVPDFSFTPTCLGEITAFTDNTAGVTTGWDWDFGDSNTSTLQDPANLYQAAGTYTVSLTVQNGNCINTYSEDIDVNIAPVAAFSGQDVCAQVPVNFSNTSSIASGSIASWHWDFGDFELIPAIPNSTSTVFEPVFTFYTEGTYTVELIATSDKGCKDTVENVIEIFPVPQAFFTTANVCYSYDALFNDQSIINNGVIANWDWEFGDNLTSTQQSPTHNYANTGFYAVNLTVTSDNNCSSDFTDYVRVHPNPVADFVATEVCVGTTTDFNNQSVISLGNIVSSQWDFDDTNSSLLTDPQNQYATPGIYDVQLIVTSDSACADTIVKQVDVNGYPVVDFSVSPLEGCAPLEVSCTDMSSIEAGETIASYDWQFSDGGSSTDQDAVHVFGTDGTFSVILTVTSADGCATTKDSIGIITVFPKPNAAFNFGPQPTNTFNMNINFTDFSAGGTEWLWDFGDFTSDTVPSPSHLYPDSGRYVVTQIVTNANGCSDTVAHMVIIDGAFAMYVPSAFTPDGDRLNDLFMPKGFGFTDFSFRVYNRWGQQLFSTSKYGEGWDGTLWNTGKELPNDLYVYAIEVWDYNNEQHKYNGTVTLVK